MSAVRIVMSVSALSSCRALNSPLVMLLAGLFAFLMHLFTSALRLCALGADRCLQASSVLTSTSFNGISGGGGGDSEIEAFFKNRMFISS